MAKFSPSGEASVVPRRADFFLDTPQKKIGPAGSLVQSTPRARPLKVLI